MTESGDYFQAEVVKRDFNEVKKITKDFSKLSKECYGGLQQLNVFMKIWVEKWKDILKSNLWMKLHSVITQDEASAPTPQLGEIADEEEQEEATPIQESIKKKV